MAKVWAGLDTDAAEKNDVILENAISVAWVLRLFLAVAECFSVAEIFGQNWKFGPLLFYIVVTSIWRWGLGLSPGRTYGTLQYRPPALEVVTFLISTRFPGNLKNFREKKESQFFCQSRAPFGLYPPMRKDLLIVDS